METLVHALNVLNIYLLHPDNPDAKDALDHLMEEYEADRDAFNRDFYTITLASDGLPKKIALTLLTTMGIPENQHGRYIHQDITVYQFLTELEASTENGSLKCVISLIEKHHKTDWKAIIDWIALLSTSSVVPFWLYSLTAIEQFVTAASVVAASGLAYSAMMTLYTLSYIYSSKEEAPYTGYQLFKDNFFALSNSAFVVSAWALLLTAAASTPVVSILFVAAELVHVVKEGVALASMVYQKKHAIQPSDTLGEKQMKVRQRADVETRKHDVYVNLTAAILMTLITAAWCFIPGGFIVPLVCMVATGVVKATRLWAIRQNKARVKEKVQADFRVLEQDVAHESPSVEKKPQRGRSMSLIEKESVRLNPSPANRSRSSSDPSAYCATGSAQRLFYNKRQAPKLSAEAASRMSLQSATSER